MGVDLGSGFDAKLDRLRTDPGKVFDNTEQATTAPVAQVDRARDS